MNPLGQAPQGSGLLPTGTDPLQILINLLHGFAFQSGFGGSAAGSAPFAQGGASSGMPGFGGGNGGSGGGNSVGANGTGAGGGGLG